MNTITRNTIHIKDLYGFCSNDSGFVIVNSDGIKISSKVFARKSTAIEYCEKHNISIDRMAV